MFESCRAHPSLSPLNQHRPPARTRSEPHDEVWESPMPQRPMGATVQPKEVIQMSTYHVPAREWHGVSVAPTTHMGRWAVALALVSGVGWLVALPALVVDPTADAFVPWGILLLVGLIPGFVCGIVASILAFLAMVRRGERAVSVYLGYVPVACIFLAAALNSLFFN